MPFPPIFLPVHFPPLPSISRFRIPEITDAEGRGGREEVSAARTAFTREAGVEVAAANFVDYVLVFAPEGAGGVELAAYAAAEEGRVWGTGGAEVGGCLGGLAGTESGSDGGWGGH